MDVRREYTNGEITVVWESKKCIHSGNCVRGLPQVFNLKKHPWIDATGADSETICAQVDKCPSGALTWYRNEGLDGRLG